MNLIIIGIVAGLTFFLLSALWGVIDAILRVHRLGFAWSEIRWALIQLARGRR